MTEVNVITLKQFYSSPLGVRVATHISKAISRIWGADCGLSIGENVLFEGFAIPYIELIKSELEYNNDSNTDAGTTKNNDNNKDTRGTLVPVMLASQGGLYWPLSGRNQVVLTDEKELPLADNTINRAVIIHTLEHSSDIKKAVSEIYSVLVAGGRALFIVPNRRSMWARAVSTPLGCGRPFSSQQLRELLTGEGFTPVSCSTALFTPPVKWRFMIKMSPWLEALGRIFLPAAGGVIMMEVEKQIYASLDEPVKNSMTSLLYPAAAADSLSPTSSCGRYNKE